MSSRQPYSVQVQDQLDYEFIQRVAGEVTQSCALPFSLPVQRIPEIIRQAAQYFYLNSDFASEERYYVIPNSEVCKGNAFNKIVKLPEQILSVHGVYKINSGTRFSTAGDFSIERIMMSSYNMFGGAGMIGSGFAGSGAGYSLSDLVVSMYEVDTFNQALNAPLSYNYNIHSHKLVLLGDLGNTDIVICCMVRCRVQDLYDDYYFFRYVCALCRRSLAYIIGTYDFKLPGGVTINYSQFSDLAEKEIDEVKEYLENNRAVDYFFMSNTL